MYTVRACGRESRDPAVVVAESTSKEGEVEEKAASEAARRLLWRCSGLIAAAPARGVVSALACSFTSQSEQADGGDWHGPLVVGV